jgi:hypothetical protein
VPDYFPAIPACSLYKGHMTHPPQPRGRVCEEWDCDTLLSRYNPGELCSIHEPELLYGTVAWRAAYGWRRRA